MVWENFSTLILNIGLMGGGIASGVIAMILGIARGSHSNFTNPQVQDTYPLVFAIFAWMIALIIPNLPLGATLFAMGAIAITFAYNNLFKQFTNNNIWYLAIIVLIVNLSLLGTIAIYKSPYSHQGIQGAQQLILDEYNKKIEAVTATLPNLGVCDDYPTIEGEECNSNIFRGIFNAIVQFAPVENIINVGAYAAIAVEAAVQALAAPYIIMKELQNLVSNSIAAILIGIYGMFWNLALAINLIRFALGGWDDNGIYQYPDNIKTRITQFFTSEDTDDANWIGKNQTNGQLWIVNNETVYFYANNGTILQNISVANIFSNGSQVCTPENGLCNHTNMSVAVDYYVNETGDYAKWIQTEFINSSNTPSMGINITDTGSDLIIYSPVGGNNYFGISTDGAFTQLYGNPGPANDYLLFTITETQGADTEINFYEGGTGHNRFWDSGSARFGGNSGYLCSELTTEVDCDTSATGADVVVQDSIWSGGEMIPNHINMTDTSISELHNLTTSNNQSITHNASCIIIQTNSTRLEICG